MALVSTVLGGATAVIYHTHYSPYCPYIQFLRIHSELGFLRSLVPWMSYNYFTVVSAALDHSLSRICQFEKKGI